MTQPLVEHQARGTTIHVALTLFERPHPYTRFATEKGRWNVYQQWRSRIRDIAKAALREAAVPPFGQGEILGAAFAFGATLTTPPTARRRRDGEPDQRTASSVASWDLGNLVKAAEDALNGVLWHDDKQVRFYGPCYAVCDHTDYLSIHVWSAVGGRPWDSGMEEMTVFWHGERN